MRMELTGREKANTIQEGACRTWDPAFSIISWHAKGRFASGRNSKENAVLTKLSPVQIQNNKTRGTTPGLKDLSLGIAGGIIPLPRLRPGKGEARSRRNVATQTIAIPAQTTSPTDATIVDEGVAYRQPSAPTNPVALTLTGSVNSLEGFGHSHPIRVQQRFGGSQPDFLNPGPSEKFPTIQDRAYVPRLMNPSPENPDYDGPWNSINIPTSSQNQSGYIDNMGPNFAGSHGQYRKIIQIHLKESTIDRPIHKSLTSDGVRRKCEDKKMHIPPIQPPPNSAPTFHTKTVIRRI